MDGNLSFDLNQAYWTPTFDNIVNMYQSINLLAAATNLNYFTDLASSLSANGSSTLALLSYNSTFPSIIGQNASARLLASSDTYQPFHEMGTYNKATNSLFITSNYNGSLENPINVTILNLDDYSWSETRYPNLYEANGGTNYYPPGTSNSTTPTPPLVLFCDEGDFEHPSSLVTLDPTTNATNVILNNYLGRNFSSLNDVRQHPVTGDIWFTDAAYGYFQYFRPKPSMPLQVHRFVPSTGEIFVVADGFDQPNGLEFSPDLKTLYITDTGAQHFTKNLTRPATVYAYDVLDNATRLGPRRIFAYEDNGFPDGIHCDTMGNVWTGAGDGVHVWSPQGELLGKLWVGETVNNFAFAPGKVFVFGNDKLWVVEGVDAVGREICRDFGPPYC